MNEWLVCGKQSGAEDSIPQVLHLGDAVCGRHDPAKVFRFACHALREALGTLISKFSLHLSDVGNWPYEHYE